MPSHQLHMWNEEVVQQYNYSLKGKSRHEIVNFA